MPRCLAEVAGTAQEAPQRAQVLAAERRDVERRAAVELAAPDRPAHHTEAGGAAVEQAQVRGVRRERPLHEGGLVALAHAKVEAPHAPRVRADPRREILGNDLEAPQAVVPDADRPRAAGAAGEEAAEAEVVAHEL